ncbi:MAG: hypothetical protein CV087_21130 [Candidatus Brocadia sp. WS118]|nr:MAG: hypothetical protein CV087_21130 [Candidatus Brocadia sp. WS118]
MTILANASPLLFQKTKLLSLVVRFDNMKDYTKGKSPEMLEPFFPNELSRHIIVSCFLVILEMGAVIFFPLSWKAIDRPDHIPWFLLPVYKLHKLVHNEVLFIFVLVLSALLFVSWPFLVRDKKWNVSSFHNAEGKNGSYAKHSKERCNLWHRPVLFAIVISTIISLITLCFIKT